MTDMAKYEVDPIGEARRYWSETKGKNVEKAQPIVRCKDCERYKKRIEQLEDLCRDLYRIAAHEGYIGDGLHNRLVELGFAEGE